MTDEVRQWLAKSDGDFVSARREAQADPPNPDLALFLCQQCIEKLIKATLIARQIVPPKTHDLHDLSARLANVEPRWTWPAEDLFWLTKAAVDYRYPGSSAAQPEAARAIEMTVRMRAALLALL